MKVPVSTVIMCIVTFVVCLLGPTVLMLLWHKRTKANIGSFFKGALSFILFGIVIKSLFQMAVVWIAGSFITGNLIVLAVFGGLCAGFFEEFGRYLALTKWMKDSLDKENTVMYGIGHGGVEAMIVICSAYISNLLLIFTINSGQLDMMLQGLDAASQTALLEAVSQLVTTPSWLFGLALAERVSAVILHIGFSWLVYCSIKENNKKKLYAAIGWHAAVDAVSVILNSYVSPVVIEVLLLVQAVLVLVWLRKEYQKEHGICGNV